MLWNVTVCCEPTFESRCWLTQFNHGLTLLCLLQGWAPVWLIMVGGVGLQLSSKTGGTDSFLMVWSGMHSGEEGSSHWVMGTQKFVIVSTKACSWTQPCTSFIHTIHTLPCLGLPSDWLPWSFATEGVNADVFSDRYKYWNIDPLAHLRFKFKGIL